MKLEIRDLHKLVPDDEVEGTHDIVFTDEAGVTRYSDDIYSSAGEAQQALEKQLASNEEPTWWEVFTPPVQGS